MNNNENEKRFRLMADNSPVMIWMTDALNNLEYMNKTKLDFLGKKSDELTYETWLETRHPDDRERFLHALLEAAKEKKNFSIEIRVKDRNGNYRWLLDSAAPRFLDDGTFAGFIGSGIDITEKKELNIKLQNSLEEKDLLLREIHHRVKNNLQIISSLLSLQSIYIEDERALEVFRTSQERVRIMAVLHEKLCQSDNFQKMNLKEYLTELIHYLKESFGSMKDINIKMHFDNIYTEASLSISIGLIVNELVSNAFKHAFKSREKGEVSVEVIENKNKGGINLSVSDNGTGLPENFSPDISKSLGLELVSTLVTQHDGEMEIRKNGLTQFCVYFPTNGILQP